MGTETSEGVGTEDNENVGRKLMEEKIVDRILEGSDAAEPYAGLEVERLTSAMKKHCFIWDTLVSDLEDQYDLETCSVLSAKLSLDLASPPYSILNARAEFYAAQYVLSRESMKAAMSLIGHVMAFRAHAHLFCADLMLYH